MVRVPPRESLRASRARLAYAVGLLRGPFDGSTALGRSKERYRRIALAALASGGARALNVVMLLVSVPLTIGYLGTERYGVWIAIGSLWAILGFADLGITNGLISAISKADARNDRELAARYASSAWFVLLGIAVALGALTAAVYPFVDWAALFNVSSDRAAREVGPAMAIFVGCLLAGLPLGVVQRIQLGYQEGFVSNLWLGAANAASLVGIVVAAVLEAPVPVLVAAQSGAPVVAGIANGFVLLVRTRPWLRPRFELSSMTIAKPLLRTGIGFLFLQVGVGVALQSNIFIVAQVLGPTAVTELSVPLRLFMLAPFVLGLVLMPLWPAYSDALARRDVAWVRSALKRSIKGGVAIVAIPSLALVVFGSTLIEFWTRGEVKASLPLLLCLGLWAMVYSLWTILSTFLNGMQVVKIQAIFVGLTVLVNIPVAIVLTQTLGLYGAILATATVQLVLNICPLLFYLRRILPTLASQEAGDHSLGDIADDASQTATKPSG